MPIHFEKESHLKIDWKERVWRGSVRECAEFLTPSQPGAGSPLGRWRLALGQRWHKEINQREKESRADSFQSEVPVEGSLVSGNWTFLLEGRIDQVLQEESHSIIREVKTVMSALPVDSGDLRNEYPHYFLQLYLYLALWKSPTKDHSEIEGELLFVDSTAGFTQSVKAGSREDWTLSLEQHLSIIASFLEEGRERREQRKKEEILNPFPDWRSEQTALLAEFQLKAKSANDESAQLRLLEAPPGFGKTLVTLYQLLNELRDGKWDRLILLTAKRSGQDTFQEHLCAMLPGESWRCAVFPSQERAAPFCSQANCRRLGRCAPPVDVQMPAPPWPMPDNLWSQSVMTGEALAERGGVMGCCPYQFAKQSLAISDIWILDLNYLFAPRPRQFIESVPAFDGSQTVLLIDEAHNLPDRVARAWSFRQSAHEWELFQHLLQPMRGGRLLRSAAVAMRDALDGLHPGRELSPDQESEIAVSLKDLQEAWDGADREVREMIGIDWRDALWSVPDWLQSLEERTEDYYHHCSGPGIWIADCFNAAPRVEENLARVGGAFMMSGTFNPLSVFLNHIGFEAKDAQTFFGKAQWREGAFQTAIDARWDTRYSKRQQFYPKLAEALLDLLATTFQYPVVVFFPSYQFAEDTSQYVRALSDFSRIAIQPRGLGPEDAAVFVEESCDASDFLFLVLGGSLAESVDRLGGKVDTAVIVSPGLPEPGPVQKAREARSSDPREVTYDQHAIIPSMRRINQAVGRLVRRPGERARVLLMCKRFTQPPYFYRLDPALGDPEIITSRSEWLDWLQSSTIDKQAGEIPH